MAEKEVCIRINGDIVWLRADDWARLWDDIQVGDDIRIAEIN